MIGKITDTSRDMSGKYRVTLTLESDPNLLDELIKAERLSIEMKPYKKKRSNDANGYLWALIGKIAAKAGCTPREAYREAIRDIGDNYTVVCVKNKAVERLRQNWETHGLGWVTDIADSKLDGCTNVILYYGSSTYDTEQFSRLIDTVIREAKLLNIDTATPEEIARMREQ